MKKALLLFLLIGFLSPLVGIAQQINSVKIQYINPGVNNNIEVIAFVELSSTPAGRVGYSSSISNDTLYLTACYFSGQLLAMSYIWDTLLVGSVPSTVRGLHFKTYWSRNQNICDSIISDKKTIAFVVSAPLGIKPAVSNPEIAINPNPADDFISIESSPLKQITLRDLSGKLIRTDTFKGETSIKLDVSALQKGFYLLETTTRQGQVSRQRLLKN